MIRPLEAFAINNTLTLPFYKHKPPGGAIAGVDNDDANLLQYSLKAWLLDRHVRAKVGVNLTARAKAVEPLPCIVRRDFKIRPK